MKLSLYLDEDTIGLNLVLFRREMCAAAGYGSDDGVCEEPLLRSVGYALA